MNALAVFSPNDPVAVVWGGTSGIGLAIFLASDASELVTGQTYRWTAASCKGYLSLAGRAITMAVTKASPLYSSPPCLLKDQPQAQLGLPGVAQAALYGAIEIEQQTRGFGVLRIGPVSQVEGIHNGLQGESLGQFEVLVGAEIKREERIVLP